MVAKPWHSAEGGLRVKGSPRPEPSRVAAGFFWCGYAVAVGVLAVGSGYALGGLTGSFAMGVGVTVVFTAAAGWWGPPLLRRSVRARSGSAVANGGF